MAAVADVGGIAPVKHPGNDKLIVLFVVKLVKIYIPENTAVKLGNGAQGRLLMGFKGKNYLAHFMPFFNKLRLSLIKTDRLKRYLLYAVGEIVLVVIGILIALQISNWSDLQKEREKEQTYLKSIKEDLETEKANIEKIMARRISKIRSASKIWAIYSDSVQGDSLGFHIANLAKWEVVTPGMNTWKELISTGDLHLIQNPEIKKRLANLMARYERLNVLQHTHHRREYEVYFYDEIFKTIDFDKAFPGMLDYNDGVHSLALSGNEKEILFQNVKQNLILKNGIQIVSSANKSGLRHASHLHKDLEDLLRLVGNELNADK